MSDTIIMCVQYYYFKEILSHGTWLVTA